MPPQLLRGLLPLLLPPLLMLHAAAAAEGLLEAIPDATVGSLTAADADTAAAAAASGLGGLFAAAGEGGGGGGGASPEEQELKDRIARRKVRPGIQYIQCCNTIHCVWLWLCSNIVFKLVRSECAAMGE